MGLKQLHRIIIIMALVNALLLMNIYYSEGLDAEILLAVLIIVNTIVIVMYYITMHPRKTDGPMAKDDNGEYWS